MTCSFYYHSYCTCTSKTETTEYYIFDEEVMLREGTFWPHYRVCNPLLHVMYRKDAAQIRPVCCVYLLLKRRNVCVCVCVGECVRPRTHRIEYSAFNHKHKIWIKKTYKSLLLSSVCPVCAQERAWLNFNMHLKVFCVCVCVYLDWISTGGIFDLEQEDACY